MGKSDARVERKRFLIGFISFMGAFLASYAWVLWITPIPAASAGLYALLCFGIGVCASIVLIFTRHSLVGLGGALSSILFVVLFAFTWPLLH